MKIEIEDVNQRFSQIYYNLYALRIVSSRKEYGDSLGIFNYSYIESGKRKLSLKTICDVANLYGVSINWLFTGEGEMFLNNGKPAF